VLPHVSKVELDVQDGLNTVVVTIRNPRGALPVRDQLGAAVKLAKRVLPKFHWA
jgi:hypothetical protein